MARRGRRRGGRIPRLGGGIDDRLRLAGPLRSLLNKVFPDHWSFLLGEIALYSFVILVLTGTFLALFFDPSQAEVVYDGVYTPLRGLAMTRAYESSLDLSFEVRGGLIMRQVHHWAALLFLAAILAHMLRIFFTGAFRRPREFNWAIGVLLFWLGFVEGFAGYSLPDDALSGTGLRIAHAIVLSVPLVGSWAATSLFDGEFPGQLIIDRLYIAHVFLLPGLIVVLIATHLAILVRQKHTQWPGPGRTERNVVGERLAPGFAARSGAFFVLVCAVVALLGGTFQINPLWLWGPYEAAVVSSASQPDWYVWFLDGALRLFPPWEVRLFGYTLPPVFWAGVMLPAVLTALLLAYPWREPRRGGDRHRHELLQRPRDVPERSALGAMALAVFLVLSLSATNDVAAVTFHLDLDALVWAGRIALVLAPPVAYYVTYRVCLGLQQHDREVLAHGIETGVVRRLPSGEFVEVHQPLGPPDDEGGHRRLDYAGWAVPKRVNRVAALSRAVRGFFVPVETPAPPPARQLPSTMEHEEEPAHR